MRGMPASTACNGLRRKGRSKAGLAAASAAGLALIVAAALAPSAAAQLTTPKCPGVGEPRLIHSGEGLIESVIVKRGHGLLFTSGPEQALKLLPRLGRPSRTVVSGVEAPGGIVPLGRDRVVLGFGDSIPQGVLGNIVQSAGLLTVDLRRGSASVRAEGLQMANGIARGRDGTIYASNDFGVAGIDRIRGREVEVGWAPVLSANGLVVDRENRYLYAAQTFVPAAIARVDLARPGRVTTFARPGLLDIAGGLDGMTSDNRGNLYAAANASGAALRFSPSGEACSLARGIPSMSDLAFGRGERGFKRTSMFTVSFLGEIVEIPNARPRR